MKKIDEFNAEDRIDIKLLENSVHFLSGNIDDFSALSVIKWIVYENLDTKSTKSLTLYINSPGGDLYQAFAVIDAIKSSRLPIQTIGIGQIMSAAFMIFISGAKGKRVIAKNTGIMCHQFSETLESKYHDIKSAMKEADYVNDRMMTVLIEATGLPAAKIKSRFLSASDSYFTAENLIELGAADLILS